MIKCNKCGSNIALSMKHAIKSNHCPYCGEHIMGNESLKACREISSKLLNSGFNKSINELSIFIYKNYVEVANSEDSEVDTLEEGENLEAQNFVEEEESVLSEQVQEPEGEGSFFEEEDEEGGDKISRLKKLARNNPILNKKGTVVRRVST